MGNTFGKVFRVTTFGESHGPALGVVIDGCPPGVHLDLEALQQEMNRRRPGHGDLVSSREEPDQVEVLSGFHEGVTLGSPLSLMIRNTGARSCDYDHLADVLRPGHADQSTLAKYGVRDHRGGGRASARETAGRVAAGSVARQLLRTEVGVEVVAWVDAVGAERAPAIDVEAVGREAVDAQAVRCPDPGSAARMREVIERARDEGDSVGAAVSCIARGVPAGWGEPVFDKMSADLAKALMSLPAARAFEVGEGFKALEMKGSEHNDPLVMDGGKVRATTNHAGGMLGGITTGGILRMRVGFKPVPTIAKPQRTVTVLGEETVLRASGRHDPCVGPRAVPAVEAMVLLVLADHYLRLGVAAPS